MHRQPQHTAQHFATIAFTILVGGLPLVWPGLGDTSSDQLPKRLVLCAIASVICVLWLWSSNSDQPLSSPLILPATVYVFWNATSLAWATNPFTGLIEVIQLVVCLILFVAFIQLAIIQNIHTLSRAVAVGGFVVSAIGIAQYLGLGFADILSVGLPSSTFIFRNFLAAYLLCAIPFALFAFLTEQKNVLSLLWLISLSVMVLCLIYTRTRGAWISLAGVLSLLIIFLILFSSLRQIFAQICHTRWATPLTRWGMIVCLILIIAGATRPAQTAPKVIQQFDEKKSSATTAITTLLTPGSDRGRFSMWNHTLAMIADHPIIGVGIDNWEYRYPHYDTGEKVTYSSEPVRPHNDILWIASELGLVGLGLYFYLLFIAVRTGLTHLKNQERAIPALIALLGIAALVGYSMFSFPKEQPIPALFFWIFLAMLSDRKTSSQNHPHVFAVLSIAICLSAIYLTSRHITFDVHYHRARALDQVNRLPQAYAEIQRALKVGDFDHRARFLKAHYLQQMGRNPEAATAYLHALEAHPNYAHSHHNLGGVYAAQKEFHQAIASYQKAITLRPGYYQAQLHLGNAFAAIEQNSQAIEAYKQAIKTQPSFAQAHTNLGALYLRRKDYSNAIDAFKKSIYHQSSNPEAYNNLAYAYEQTGNLSDAIIAYKNLLKYWKGDPSYRETVRQHISDLLAKVKGH